MEPGVLQSRGWRPVRQDGGTEQQQPQSTIMLGMGQEAPLLPGLNTQEIKARFPFVIGTRRHKRHGFNSWVRKIPWRRK